MIAAIDDENGPADYSVCMKTVSGPVYLSEFRTLSEAVQIAEQAYETSGCSIEVRQSGRLVRTFQSVLTPAGR